VRAAVEKLLTTDETKQLKSAGADARRLDLND
jgi:hypothetical protein